MILYDYIYVCVCVYMYTSFHFIAFIFDVTHSTPKEQEAHNRFWRSGFLNESGIVASVFFAGLHELFFDLRYCTFW